MKSEFKLVTKFDVLEYRCGLKSGDKLSLVVDIVVKDHKGNPTGKVHKAGTTWLVLNGSSDDPGTVRLMQPDGKVHFWDDSPSIFDTFRRFQ